MTKARVLIEQLSRLDPEAEVGFEDEEFHFEFNVGFQEPHSTIQSEVIRTLEDTGFDYSHGVYLLR